MKHTNVRGATPVCAAYKIRTCRRPGLAGGCTAVTSRMNLFISGVGTRFMRAAATMSTISSRRGVRSPVAAESGRLSKSSTQFYAARTSPGISRVHSGIRPVGDDSVNPFWQCAVVTVHRVFRPNVLSPFSLSGIHFAR